MYDKKHTTVPYQSRQAEDCVERAKRSHSPSRSTHRELSVFKRVKLEPIDEPTCPPFQAATPRGRGGHTRRGRDRRSSQQQQQPQQQHQKKQQLAASLEKDSIKRLFSGVSRTSSDVTDREGSSLAQRHLKLITDIEAAITGGRTGFGTCKQFSNKDSYVAKLQGYLLQKGVDEQSRTIPTFVYGETLSSLLSETYFRVNTLTAVQLHSAARYLHERHHARLTALKV